MTAYRQTGASPLGDRIDVQLAAIEDLADAGHWSQTAAALSAIPDLVGQIPADNREQTLRLIQGRVDALRVRLVARRKALGGRLVGLKDGRRAAASYLATGSLGGKPLVGP